MQLLKSLPQHIPHCPCTQASQTEKIQKAPHHFSTKYELTRFGSSHFLLDPHPQMTPEDSKNKSLKNGTQWKATKRSEAWRQAVTTIVWSEENCWKREPWSSFTRASVVPTKYYIAGCVSCDLTLSSTSVRLDLLTVSSFQHHSWSRTKSPRREFLHGYLNSCLLNNARHLLALNHSATAVPSCKRDIFISVLMQLLQTTMIATVHIDGPGPDGDLSILRSNCLVLPAK